jgi:hypothetical protein
MIWLRRECGAAPLLDALVLNTAFASPGCREIQTLILARASSALAVMFNFSWHQTSR